MHVTDCMLHAGVRQIVLICNVFKTKVRDPRRSAMNAARRGLEATAALPLMYGGMAAWCGHAGMTFSTPGASIDEAEACTGCALCVRRLRAVSW